MRWSQIFVCLLTVLFAVAFHEVLGHSNDHHSSTGGHRPTIERRAPAKTRSQTRSKKPGHKPPSAASFKSSNYRKVAMKSGRNYDPHKNTVKISKITPAQAKEKDAGMSLISARWKYSLTRRQTTYSKRNPYRRRWKKIISRKPCCALRLSRSIHKGTGLRASSTEKSRKYSILLGISSWSTQGLTEL